MFQENNQLIAADNIPQAVRDFAYAREIQNGSVSFYEDTVPAFAEDELERLYENFYSSFYSFYLSGDTGKIHTYVARQGDEIKTLLLFTLEKGRIRVLNELIRLSESEIKQFIEQVFWHFPAATSISLRAIEMPALRLSFPFQQFNLTEDIVLRLPGSVQEYQSSLGKSTRKTVNENMNRLKRRFPSFEFQAYDRADAKEEQIRAIIRFNRERMASKAKTPSLEEEETQHILSLVKSCGVVFVASVEDRICAGQICFQIGSNYFSLLNAHSPQFNEYRLGTLCNYLSICECIRRGGKEFHFLWGREEFKYRFLGEQRDFDELVIYRSPLHMALNGGLALKTALSGRKRQARLWLLDPERKGHAAIKLARNTLRTLRRV